MIDPTTLLAIGPSVLRLVGGLFGGKTKQVAEQVAGFAEQVKGLPAEQARREFRQRLAELPPEAMVELRKLAVESQRIQAEQAQAAMQAETDQYRAAQETIRTELQMGNDFVRETRPRIARRSFAAGVGYVLVAEAARLAGSFPGVELAAAGADPAIASILFGPCVWYFTMRTADAFSKKGKS